jgi:hypothetical protein
MNNKGKIAIAAAALAAFASIGLITNQASASNSPVTPPAITVPTLPSVMPSADAPETSNSAIDGDNIQSGDQSGDQTRADVAGAPSETDGTAGATEGDNVQSGDQTTVDVAGATDGESNN